jgi:hypothetical protein
VCLVFDAGASMSVAGDVAICGSAHATATPLDARRRVEAAVVPGVAAAMDRCFSWAERAGAGSDSAAGRGEALTLRAGAGSDSAAGRGEAMTLRAGAGSDSAAGRGEAMTVLLPATGGLGMPGG